MINPARALYPHSLPYPGHPSSIVFPFPPFSQNQNASLTQSTMKRSVRKLSNASVAELLLLKTSPKHQTLTSPLLSNFRSNHNRFIITTQTRCLCSNQLKLVNLFTAKETETTSRIGSRDLYSKLLDLSDELITNQADSEKIEKILDSKGGSLLRRYSDDLASVELLAYLKAWPYLALEVFEWRRKEANADFPMVAEEFAKGITIAGRVKNVDLAVELFAESTSRGIKSASVYNALMGAYMFNGLTDKAQEVFRELKKERDCSPTIVTYNILISIFGRLMLVDHMEATFREIKDLNLSPNPSTYNHLIAGYVTAWMWDDMERMFRIMESGPVKPDLNSHLLMLRGYAHSGNLEQMEKTYELVKHYVNEKEMPLIRAMICAYCRSSDKDRVRKVETLMRLIPEDEYRPWLNVLLIRLYAQEDLVEGMENFISMAFKHKTSVSTVGVMRSIIAAYFRRNAVERLTNFVTLAESSGWKICRSLYHCKMVMFASQNRLEEMENVVYEMEQFNLDPTRKTFLIMYKAYMKNGQRSKIVRIVGTMCKHGFGIPGDTPLW